MNIIKNIQKETGLSQSEIARRVGTHQQTVNRYASGRSNMPIDRLISWCNKLNINICKILRDET